MLIRNHSYRSASCCSSLVPKYLRDFFRLLIPITRTAKIKITLVKSKIGSDKTQVGTIQALGLKKTNSSVEKEATPQILGMVAKISHLVRVEEVK